jgi:hypothetical protein
MGRLVVTFLMPPKAIAMGVIRARPTKLRKSSTEKASCPPESSRPAICMHAKLATAPSIQSAPRSVLFGIAVLSASQFATILKMLIAWGFNLSPDQTPDLSRSYKELC